MYSIMLHYLPWQSLRDNWQGFREQLCRLCTAQLQGMPLTAQAMELFRVQPAHVCSSSNSINWAHTTLCFSSANYWLGLDLFKEEVAVEQLVISLLLFLFPSKAISPWFGLKSQEMWVMKRSPSPCAAAWRLGGRGRRGKGPGRYLNWAGNQSSQNLSPVSSGFILGTNWKCLSLHRVCFLTRKERRFQLSLRMLKRGVITFQTTGILHCFFLKSLTLGCLYV